jgi:hypothetical protein
LGLSAAKRSELVSLLDTRDALALGLETSGARISTFTGAAAALCGGDFSLVQPTTPIAVHARRIISRRSMALLLESAARTSVNVCKFAAADTKWQATKQPYHLRFIALLAAAAFGRCYAKAR